MGEKGGLVSFIYQIFHAVVVTGSTKRNEAPGSEVDRFHTQEDSSPGLFLGRGAGLCCLHFAVLAHGSVAWSLECTISTPLPVGGEVVGRT